jgi:hypothetical protein
MRLREVNKHCKEIKGGGGSWVKSRWKNCTTKPNNNSQKKNRGNHHARPRIEHQQYRRNTEKEK